MIKILDPVHKYMTFSDQEALLIDSMIFQRLRYVRQLGFAEFAFPGAVHNRFIHSLGVCHLAGIAFDQLSFLKQFLPAKKREEFRLLVRVAALLHDLGHGPLSHSSEIRMPCLKDLAIPFLDSNKQATHEHYTIKIILNSPITKIIKSLGIDPQYVAHFINPIIPLPDKNFFTVKGINFKPLLTQIISSNLDVDRMDYLQRDSYFCGVEYGLCDHKWILNKLRVYIDNDQAFIGIDQKAVFSVENFFLCRKNMGLIIYFHSKMVIMDEMLKKYFNSEDCDFNIPVCLEQYSECTDNSVFNNLRSHVNTNPWAARIIQNKPYEVIYEGQYIDSNKAQQLKKLCHLKDFLNNKNIFFIETNSLDHIKKWHFNDNPRYPLYVVDNFTNKLFSFKNRLEVFNQNPIFIDRLYISPEDKNTYHKSINKLIQ